MFPERMLVPRTDRNSSQESLLHQRCSNGSVGSAGDIWLKPQSLSVFEVFQSSQ